MRSLCGSENIFNVLWTAPTLIGLNMYMNRRLNSLTMTKYFFLSYMSIWIFYSAINPDTGLNKRLLNKWLPRFDSFDTKGRYYMGADHLALSLFYFTLLYHAKWQLALPLMAFDLLYYGPVAFGGVVAAPVIGALCLL